jgi:transcriptional regulator with XRE-family HTH domain
VELLSLFLNGLSSDSGLGAIAKEPTARSEYLLLRQRLIGAQLRAARESISWSIEALSERAGLEAGQIKRFELGEEKIPVCDLAALAQSLKTDLSFFAAIPPAPRESLPRQEHPEYLVETHADPRQFAAQNENSAFIKLAMAFKHIEPDDLHRIADALFAIIGAKGEASGRPGSPS